MLTATGHESSTPAGGGGQGRRARPPWDRTFIFWLELIYLGALAALAVLYFTDVITPRKALGPLPIAIPWFGALGGVLVSLTGVFDHAHDWDPGQRLWHISRPFLGAMVGIVAVLIFKAGILAAGVDPNPSASSPGPALDNLFYYLVAFAVGYREQSFREMMKRMLDVVLAPGTTPANPSPSPGAAVPAISSLTPAAGPVAGGTPVTLTGTGLSTVRTVRFGKALAEFEVIGDTELSTTSPAAAQAGTVTISASGPSGSDSAGPFTYA